MVVVDSNGDIRPCIMLPAQYFDKITLEDYKDIVENGKILDTKDKLQNYERELNDTGNSLTTLKCAGFCKSV